jgi:hypothetical protein
MLAPCAASGVAAAAGRAGRRLDGLAAALADEAAGGHAFANLFAAAALALRLFAPEDEALEVLPALFTMVLVNGHVARSPVIAQVFRLKAEVYKTSRKARIKPFKTFSVSLST